MYTIQTYYPQLGYLDLVKFLEKEFNNPSSGGHANFISAVQNAVDFSEDTVFVQELYSDDSTYQAFVAIAGGYVVLVDKELQPLYFTSDASKFSVDLNRGLIDFTPGQTLLFDNSDLLETSAVKALSVGASQSFGTTLYPISFRDIVTSEVTMLSYISSKITIDGYVTSYCVNLKNLGQLFINFANLTNNYLAIDIPINKGQVKAIRLKNLGDTATVPYTDTSRAFVDNLIKKGLIYEL